MTSKFHDWILCLIFALKSPDERVFKQATDLASYKNDNNYQQFILYNDTVS